MKRSLKLVLLAVAAGGVVAVTLAQTPPAAPAVAAPTAAAPAATSPAATSPAIAAPATPTPAVSPERFEPTDKVRADFDVSFPIDI